jgi:hypothetical protein
MSDSISRRTREIGVRVALGSPIGRVQRLVVRQAMLLTLIATGPGLAAAQALVKVSPSVRDGVRPHSAIAPLFLAAVALVAYWIPAPRAESVDHSRLFAIDTSTNPCRCPKDSP